MFPTPFSLFTVKTPSATVHLAGDLSLTNTQLSRFFPSNSTIASEGGSVLWGPGVTIFGTGSQTSVSCGFAPGVCCAEASATPATRVANIESFDIFMGMTLENYIPILPHESGASFRSHRDGRDIESVVIFEPQVGNELLPSHPA